MKQLIFDSLSFLVIYVVIFCIVLFMALPIGSKPPQKPGKGHAASAPENPHIGKKFLVTAIISLILSIMAFYFFEIRS